MDDLQPFVPQEWCFACRRCCRFPGTHDVQAPAFSTVEVRQAVAAGAQPVWFRPAPSLPGSHEIRLMPQDTGYRCPALESASHQCRIYAARPLDCRLYPFVLTRDAARRRLLLAADTQCPYVQQVGPGPALRDYGWYLARVLNAAPGQTALAANPALAGRPRREFWTMTPLEDPAPPPAAVPPDGFRPLTDHAPAFDEALDRTGRPLSVYHRAAWWPWRDLMRLWWGSVGGLPVVMAEQAGGYFLPLPPLGGQVTAEVVSQVFHLLEGLNGGTAVSRIENLPAPLAEQFKAWGYEISVTEREYVYDRVVLQRRAARRAARSPGLVVRPVGPADVEPCLRLYALWALRRQAVTDDEAARAMLRDGAYVHRRWLEDAEALQIWGWVAEAEQGVCGYTLGVELSREVCVVLAEVTDESVPGLAARLTEALCHGVPQPWLNAMGDAGVARLARAKHAERPAAGQPFWTADRRR